MPAEYNDYRTIKQYIEDYPIQLERFCNISEYMKEANFIDFELSELEKYPKPKKGRIHLYSQIKYFLENKLSEILQEDKKAIIAKKGALASKRSAVNKTHLIQVQYALLIHYFHEYNLFLPNSSLKLFADFFSKLTGYTQPQLYKDVKGKKEASDISQKIADFSEVISELERILTQIKMDKKSFEENGTIK